MTVTATQASAASPASFQQRAVPLPLHNAAGDAASAGAAVTGPDASNRARAADPASVVTFSNDAATYLQRLQQAAPAVSAATDSPTPLNLRTLLSELRAAHASIDVDPSKWRAPREWEGHDPDPATAAWFKKNHAVMKQMGSWDGSVESMLAISKAIRGLAPMPATAWRA